MTLEEPQGWMYVDLPALPNVWAESESPQTLESYFLPMTHRLYAFMIQIAVTHNHQNGRDSHIRLVSAYGSKECSTQKLSHSSESRTSSRKTDLWNGRKASKRSARCDRDIYLHYFCTSSISKVLGHNFPVM